MGKPAMLAATLSRELAPRLVGWVRARGASATRNVHAAEVARSRLSFRPRFPIYHRVHEMIPDRPEGIGGVAPEC